VSKFTVPEVVDRRELPERMARRYVDEVIVTTPEGELLGMVHRPKEEP